MNPTPPPPSKFRGGALVLRAGAASFPPLWRPTVLLRFWKLCNKSIGSCGFCPAGWDDENFVVWSIRDEKNKSCLHSESPRIRSLVPSTFRASWFRHRWFSGRMLACHAGGPGSIPGRCIFVSRMMHFVPACRANVTSHRLLHIVSSNNRQISKYFGFVQKPVCRAVCSAPHGTSVSQSVPIVCACRHLRARRPDNCFLWMFEV